MSKALTKQITIFLVRKVSIMEKYAMCITSMMKSW